MTTYASFNSLSDAERAYAALTDVGVGTENISIIAADPNGDKVPVAAGQSAASKIECVADHGLTVTTKGDAAAAAVPGAAIGLGVGALAALTSLLVPGVGIVLGGGALAAALMGTAGAGAAGAIAGGAYGYLRDQGVPDEAATKLHTALGEGHVILGVNHATADGPAVIVVQQIVAKYNGELVYGP